MIDVYLAVLDEGYYEVNEALIGLADDHVWKRPANRLLSIGEVAGHVAYWLPMRLTAERDEHDPAAAGCRVSGPLIDPRFRYYPTILATGPSEEQRAMTAAQVCSELLRVHRESAAYVKALNPDLDSHPPAWPQTYRSYLSYAAFHVAYHAGQNYCARHLLGETTPDN